MSRTKLKHSYLPYWTLLFLLLGSLAALAQPATPAVSITDPPTNTTVRALTFINTFFEDNVRGVDASDLLINGAPATNILVVSPREYVFYFPAPAPGPVTVAWAASHGITDLGDPPTPFAGGSWSYTVDPAANPPTLIISEFLADNNSGIKDEDGSRQDWIEIYNPGPGDASLGGWFLTDNATNLTKWQFPSVPLLAGKYLLVWASAKNRTDPAAPLHTNFRLAKEGSYLALVNPSTNVASEFDPYPPQQADVSYGRDRADANLLGYFPTPTPGAQNVVTGPSVTPEPVFSVASGVYTNATLTLSISATLGTIRYTLDTTAPTTNSPTYSSPITFGTNLVVKARAFPPQNSGLLPSRVVAGSYLFLDGTTADFSSPLPILIINTDGGAINPDVTPGSPRREGTLTIIDTFRGRSSIRSEPDFHGLAGYEIFGQTSAGFPKRPFRIEIHDELGNDLKVPVLGMPADSDFKLRNPYDDKTMLNDFLAFELFDQMGHYSVRRRMVETFIDTGGGRLNYAADYYGIMTFVETIKQGKDRVDINEITPAATNEPAITGGYIFKKDKDSLGDYNFSTAGGNFGGNVWPGEALKIHEPKPNALRTAPISGPLTPSGVKQMAWLTAYLNQMEKALYATNWLTLTGTNHYSSYLDVDSFVDFHWLVEFTKQIDGYRLSGYFTKDRGGKVVNGPAWDWNLSFGNADYLDGGHTNTWYYSEQGQGMTANEHIWLRRLINGNPNMGPGDAPGPGGDPDFNQKIADRWGVLRTNILNGSRVVARIEELSSMLSESADRDFAKYRTLSQIPGPAALWPNPGGNLNHDGTGAPGRPWDVDYVRPPSYRTGTNSIIGFMKKWVDGRYNWIDSQFTAAPQLVGTSGQVSSGTTVQITHAAGTM
ncbi:MAG TPA: CotH kinase family protein, partial [Candidatus Saccharimonadales bacterium]|nr:CotH kinase family protein [Candidatus Saccharimonadales bacterium]